VGVELDFMVTLTQYIQKRLGEAINKIDVQIEYITSWRMTAKTVEDEDEEIPF
jgi:ribonuclease D